MKEIDQRTYWDGEAASYDDAYSNAWSLKENELVQRSLAWLADLPAPHVLDLGCGTGFGYESALVHNPEMTYEGIDISLKMIERFREKHPAVSVRVGSLDNLSDFQPDSFDVVLCTFGSMSNVPSLAVVMDEAKRILKPSGWLRVSVQNRLQLARVLRFQFHEEDHFRVVRHDNATEQGVKVMRYSRGRIRRLAADRGFAVVRRDHFGVLMNICEDIKLWPVERALSKVMPSIAGYNDIVLKLRAP